MCASDYKKEVLEFHLAWGVQGGVGVEEGMGRKLRKASPVTPK